MKVYERVEVKLHAFLTSVLISGEWFILCPGHLTLEKSPESQFYGKIKQDCESLRT